MHTFALVFWAFQSSVPAPKEFVFTDILVYARYLTITFSLHWMIQHKVHKKHGTFLGSDTQNNHICSLEYFIQIFCTNSLCYYKHPYICMSQGSHSFPSLNDPAYVFLQQFWLQKLSYYFYIRTDHHHYYWFVFQWQHAQYDDTYYSVLQCVVNNCGQLCHKYNLCYTCFHRSVTSCGSFLSKPSCIVRALSSASFCSFIHASFVVFTAHSWARAVAFTKRQILAVAFFLASSFGLCITVRHIWGTFISQT